MKEIVLSFAVSFVTAICMPIIAIVEFDELMALIRSKPSVSSGR